MKNKINIIQGPPTSKVTKEAAEKQLVSHPQFPKNASYTLDEVEGRWVAAITTEAGPAFADDGSNSEAPAPELSEGPSSDGEGSPDDGPGPSGDGDDDSDDKGDNEKGEKGELKHLVELVTTLLDALGINPDGDSPIPGPDDEQGPPSPDGPPAPGPSSEKQVVRHERSLKPGESAPGTTPIGAPSFASVADDHPWKAILGKKRSFPVEEEIGDATLASVRAELDSLAEGTGYGVKQLREGITADGKRTAKALIAQ